MNDKTSEMEATVPKVHELRSWPQFFTPIVAGRRTHELRRNDRDFAVGDVLELQEFDPRLDKYTGATCRATITSITSDEQPCAVSGEGLSPGFCILSIKAAWYSSDRAPEELHGNGAQDNNE